MGLNNVTFIKGTGGLGRVLPGEDYVSGLVFYAASKPAGITAAPYIARLTSLADAVALGITNTYSDETKAVAGLKVATPGAANDTLTIAITDYTGTITIPAYTSAGSLTAGNEAIAIKTHINTSTYLHGYVASINGSDATKVNLTAPAGKGICLNSGTPVVLTLSATPTLAITLTQFAAGVASKLAQYYYQISEFFRLQPSGILWVMFADVPVSTYAWGEIATLQNAAAGKIRQMGIFANGKTSMTAADTTAIAAAVAIVDATYAPLSVLYSCDIISHTNVSSLPDLSALNNNKVSVVVAQSGSGYGEYLYNTTNKSIPALGTLLGAVALAKVSENIAWVSKYNLSDGTEMEVVRFSNGQLDTAVLPAMQTTINGYRYIFARKFIGLTGTYFNDSHCACLLSSDYAYIENNRTIDKAIRVSRTALLPQLNAPLTLNADGTLTDVTINYFTTLVEAGLAQMVRDGELSGYAVSIDETQDVLTTSKLVVNVSLLINGVARNIEVLIGFVTSL